MDGVLTDFDSAYEGKYIKYPRGSPEHEKYFFKNWKNFIVDQNFENLKWHRDAKQLLAFVEQLDVPTEILSSSGGGSMHDEVVRQKTVWLKKHNVNYKPNIVPGGTVKAQYAKPWHVLIDDTAKVVNRYREAGGPAILHVAADSTIQELKSLYNEYLNS